ncbi:hypothetical protein [Spirosoma rhododendri]|uniref:Uncharacterized protein n=1 Tax=Spirosoma rhododendri TaxID=2728024 RepID=A0A7L5DQ35_9BACT|nr:hypothetical protein [Spirosoma rhododendri]QJD80584.1 hypothetical protein HH216_20825 [Spirosoma rhododendri]
MNDFTLAQLSSIADSYLRMARTLTELQLAHWPEFTYEQQLDLNAYQNSLLNRAHDIQTRAVNPAVDQAEKLTERIQQTIGYICDRLLIINNIPVALTLGALIVALASYVARDNRKGIQSAFRELNHLLDSEHA